MMNPPRLELKNITKAYPSVVANDHVDLRVMPGEIHALLGENGAGKSTLMKIIYGVVKADDGEIFWNGRPVTISNPAEARRLGIGMVFQHFSLFETLTVVENVALAMEGRFDSGGTGKTHRRSIRALRHGAGSGTAGAFAFGGRASACGNRALSSPGTRSVDHGRAHVGTHASSRARLVQNLGAVSGRRLQCALHHSQARGITGALSQGDGDARRAYRRHRGSGAGKCRRAGEADGRPGSAGVRAFSSGGGGRRTINHRGPFAARR